MKNNDIEVQKSFLNHFCSKNLNKIQYITFISLNSSSNISKNISSDCKNIESDYSNCILVHILQARAKQEISNTNTNYCSNITLVIILFEFILFLNI